jgi:hypothetical protein
MHIEARARHNYSIPLNKNLYKVKLPNQTTSLNFKVDSTTFW